jgi:general secretion pathway protein D
MRVLYVALATFWLLLPSLSAGADSEPKPGAGSVSAANSRDTDFRVFLRDVGAHMHKHFVADPRLPQSIDLGGLNAQDVTYPELLAILELNGLVAFTDSGLVQVLPSTDARQLPTPVVSPDNIKTLDGEIITCIITVKNVSAAQLVPMLRPMIPSWGHLAALPDRNALIMVDRSGNVKRVVELVQGLEKLPKVVEAPPLPKAP